MDVFQTSFGPIEVDPESIILFPQGLPGFETCHKFKLLHNLENPNPQLLWLQSLDDEAVVFSVVEPQQLGLSYELVLSDEECDLLGLVQPEDVVVLLMLLRSSNPDAPISANFKSPLVLNLKTRKGLQKCNVHADIVFRNF